MTPSTLNICGMHRSGTSLTARWLHQCGLHLGDRLVGGGIGNEDGHFEDWDFHTPHEDDMKRITNDLIYE